MDIDPYSRTQRDVDLLAAMRDTVSAGSEAEAVVELVASRMFTSLRLEARIGRFSLLEVIGSGGMGVVYAAHDPERDEKVALKIVRPALWAEQQPGINQARLLREGGVLAHLDHPNIVKLHESGVHEDEVFVVMEFIEGPTLEQWAAAAPRSWSSIAEIYMAAGDGLAAAHARGLVHRDFKPQNVLVGPDGVPRVVDFGLARPIDTAIFGASDGASKASDPRVEYSLTATGFVTGTPAYMAPELLVGADATPSSDTYAFCTALLEALSREQSDDETPTSEVPGELLDALLRGIAVVPEDRWPSLDELLETLRGIVRAHDPSRLRRRRLVLALALVLALVLAALTLVLAQG